MSSTNLTASRPRRLVTRPGQRPTRRRSVTMEPLEARTLLDGELVEIVAGRYLPGLYHDVLGRMPEPAGLAAWRQAIAAGARPIDVVTGFVTSTENRANQVADDYRRYLGRDPEPFGLQFWGNVLATGGRQEDVLAGILGSAEYYARQGGTDASFLNGLYRDVLGRESEPAGDSFWTQVLAAGDRTGVGLGFVTSVEHRAMQVQGFYADDLGRGLDPEGLAFWLAAYAAGATQDQVQVAILTSPEYLGLSERQVDDPGAFATRLYGDVLGRMPEPAGLAGWVGAIAAGARPIDVASGFVTSTENRANRIADDYRRYLGRDPEPFGLQFWGNVLGSGGRQEDVLAGILGSAEYYARQGGTDASFLNGLYRDLLGRTPDQPGLGIWTAVLAGGDRTVVGLGFVNSLEYRSGRITSYYRDDLGRAPDPEGLAFWISTLGLPGSSLDQVQAQILASAEYLARQGGGNNGGPASLTLELDPAFDSAPIGDSQTRFETVTLSGLTSPNLAVRVGGTGRTTTADASGRYAFAGVPLAEGPNTFDASVTDAMGRVTNASRIVVRQPLPAGSQVLAEGARFQTQIAIPVDLGQAEGSRKIRFDLDAGFDTSDGSAAVEDLVLIYLVDPDDPGTTLLDRGENGTALFSRAGTDVEMAPGIVQYDGSTVTIDVTSLGDRTRGLLIVQAINSDADEGSVYHVLPLTNEVDPEGTAGPAFLAARRELATAGPALNLGALGAAPGLSIRADNVRFDTATGKYTAELRLRNDGAPIGRQAVALFHGLPAGVALVGPSGKDAAGVPYLNFQDAIPAGGLGRGAESTPIVVTFDDPNSFRFGLRPTLLAGPANRAPAFPAIGTLAVRPGQRLELPLVANDPDGDPLTFLIQTAPNKPLPRVTLSAKGILAIAPTPDEIGDYSLTLIATDGAFRVSQDLTIHVEADPVTSTRLSGRVVDTDGTPLAGVPVSLGTIQAITDASGGFTFTLPALSLPTDSFDIAVPKGDVQFDPFSTGSAKIRLQRTRYATGTGTSTANPREFPNLITSYLDANFVYGSDPTRAAALRTNDGTGRLKTSPGDLLPLNNATYFPGGPIANDNNGIHDPATLFVAGDNRANENIGLAALQTVFVREHNRLADQFRAGNPGLSDEAIYEAARRVVGAIVESITFSEFLPQLLGPNALAPYAGYNPAVNPAAGAFFATVAFRYAHSQSFPEFPLVHQVGSQPTGTVSLSEASFNSAPILANGLDPILRGLYAEPAQAVGLKYIDGVRNLLFGPPGSGGIDLLATDLQRARDLGLPGYNQSRIDVGLPAVTSFNQISSVPAIASALAATYGTVDKVDALIGGLAEDKVAGALVGPLFQRSIQDQFLRLRDGDRFWYENGQFNASELAFIRSSRLSAVLSRNTGLADLPANVFSTKAIPAGPAAGGTVRTGPVSGFRAINGAGNNPNQASRGAAGDFLRQDGTLAFGDGISTPSGSDRPNVRTVSNALGATGTFTPDPAGTTALAVIWSQLLTHDISFTPPGLPDTIKVFGDALTGSKHYPFIAEKVDLLLEHPVFEGFNNVITRPIYLPGLNPGTTIDPAVSTDVTQQLRAGEAQVKVFVAAETLKTREGTFFTGNLGITEVPVTRTPAALPNDLIPDVVVTIQPGEMVFTQPAPISFPNRSGWAPGTLMDLWSINPNTGVFDKVGQMKVSADGTSIDTISGGIRNSSWHFPAPPPPNPDDPNKDDHNEDDACKDCKGTAPGSSEIELHSGSLLEQHDLVTYQSLGVARGLSLHYDSARANPAPIVHFGYSNVVANSNQRLMARLEIATAGGATIQVPGSSGGQFNLPGGEHFWSLPIGGSVDAALQADFTGLASGVYGYGLTSGIVQLGNGNLSGSTSKQAGTILQVNGIGGIFGNGWGLASLLQIVEAADGSALLIDGDGGELLFGPPATAGMPYVAPPGDFSALTKTAAGTFSRRLTDGTVQSFNADGHLASERDRNGNTTRYEYSGPGKLSRIVDPVGLATTFTYANGQVSAITDPAGRATLLTHDAAGNLIRITDPDGTSRTWGYDARRLMTSEIDQRGAREEEHYDAAGKVVRVVRKDGSELRYDPVQAQVVYAAGRTTGLENAPAVSPKTGAVARYADAIGNVVESTLDKAGQVRSSRDNSGNLPSNARDDQNLVTRTSDARGNATFYDYDAAGNVVRIRDTVSSSISARKDNLGTEFWLGFSRNYQGNNQLLLFITSEIATRGTVEVSSIGFSQDFTTTPGEILTITLPAGAEVSSNDRIESLGIHVTSEAPIAVYGLSRQQFTTDGYLGLPVAALGTNYLAMTYQNNGLGVQVLVIGTQDGTQVSITPKVTIGTHAANVPYTITLNKGQTYQLFTTSGDLTGTEIVGSAPIAVFSGNRCGNVPPGVTACDYLVEQLTPTNTWGTSFVTLPLATRLRGDTFRYLASVDDTEVHVNGQVVATLNRGQVFEQLLTAASVITANQPILVAQFSNGTSFDGVTSDPFMLLVPPSEQFVNRYTVTTPASGFRVNYINVVASSAVKDSIRLDGAAIATDLFKPIAGSDFFGAQLPVELGTHRLSGNGAFGVFVYGFDNADSYGYLGGQAFSTLTFTDKTRTYDPTFGQLASMTDELGNRVVNVVDATSGNITRSTRVVGQVDDAQNGETDDVSTTFTYTARGQVDTATDALGRVIDFDYDAAGNLVAMTSAKGTPAQGTVRYAYDATGNRTAMTDENGNRTTYRYDARGRLVETTGPDPDGAGPLTAPVTRLRYDAAGNLVAITDPKGNTTLSDFDAQGRVIRTVGVDPDGSGPLAPPVTRYGYDDSGNLVTIIDPLGRVTRNTFDARQRPVAVTDPTGGVTRYSYDSDDNRIATVDPLGNRTRHVYDSRGRQVALIDPLGNTTRFGYDAADNLVSRTDAAGHVTKYAYDEMKRLVGVTDAAGQDTTMVRDALGNLISTTDPLGHQARSTYDARGRLVATTDAAGQVTARTYDAVGNLLSVRDPLGNVTRFVYDALNRRVSTTDPLNQTTRFAYDANGNVTSLVDPLGRESRYAYDGLNRLASSTDAAGNVQRLAYDAAGDLLSTTDELGRVTRYAYDGLDRQTAVIDSLGAAYRMTYDAAGDLATEVDALGKVTSYQYDASGRRTSTTDPLGGVTRYDYDAIGNTIKVTDPSGNATTFAYDALEREVSETNASGATRTHGYDASGNQVAATDRDGRARRFTFDPVGRQTSEVWLDAQGNPVRTIGYTYDAAGRMTDASDPNSAVHYAFDANGRVASSSNQGAPGAPTVVLSYSFDAAGNVVGRTDTVNGRAGATDAYSYDALDRLTRLTESGQNVAAKRVNFTYDATGRLSSLTRFADLAASRLVASTAFGYDAVGQLSSLGHQRAGVVIASYTASYDAAHHVTGTTSTADGTSRYTYDATGQLVGADHSSQADESYAYDGNGNRTGGGSQAGVDNRLTSDGTSNFAYDAEGNLTRGTEIGTGVVTDYTWDYRDRLTRVATRTSGGDLIKDVAYIYDAFDRRIAKAIDADGSGPLAPVVSRFAYDGDNVVLSLDGAGAISHRYLHGPLVDQVLADEHAGGEVFWSLTDHEGSIRDLIDSAAQVRDHIRYDSFGRIASESNPSAGTAYGYTGREQDTETGLIYFRSRYYDPSTGRFLSEDPGGFGAGDVNLYRYVGNDPASRIDPTGLDGWTRFWGGLKAVGGGLQAVGGATFALVTAETGVGVVVGGVVAVKGADNFQAGLRQLFSGEETNTLTYEAVKKLTGDCTAATVVDVGIDLVGGTGVALRTAQMAREAAQIEAGLARVAQARNALTVGQGRNIAVAEVNIAGGGTQELIGVSGQAARPGTVGNPTQRLFETFEVGHSRAFDSEVKILEDVASRISPETRGTINLFSERAVCDSCSSVINQFRQMFPNMNVNVTSGPLNAAASPVTSAAGTGAAAAGAAGRKKDCDCK